MFTIPSDFVNQTFKLPPPIHWIQGKGNGNIWIAKFTDGTPFKEWTSITGIQGVEEAISNEGEWKIPISLFGHSKRVKIFYIAGGLDEKGNKKWNADTTEWLDYNL